MRTFLRLAAAVFLLVFLAAPLWAETILLKNGRKIEGEILGEEKGRLIVSIGGAGIMQIDLDDIDKIIKDESDGSDYLERYKGSGDQTGTEEKEPGDDKTKGGTGTEVEEKEGATGWTLEKIKDDLKKDGKLVREIDDLVVAMGTAQKLIRGRNVATQIRAGAVDKLTEIGILTLPALTAELAGNKRIFGSRNATRIILSYAAENDYDAYVEAGPVFIKALSYEDQETRVAAAEILKKLTGNDDLLTRTRDGKIDPAQKAVIAKWEVWWQEEGEPYFKALKEGKNSN